jgi:hypothetical protein
MDYYNPKSQTDSNILEQFMNEAQVRQAYGLENAA